jgi:hypothetical protein
MRPKSFGSEFLYKGKCARFSVYRVDMIIRGCCLLNLADNRAVFDAGTATGAQIHLDAAGAFTDFDLEVTGRSFDGFQVCIGDQFDVQVPADLDQYGGNNSHGAVVGGKCFVQLGHDPADGGGFFKQIDVVAGIGQIQGGLHTGNSSADNQYGTNGIVGHIVSPERVDKNSDDAGFEN